LDRLDARARPQCSAVHGGIQFARTTPRRKARAGDLTILARDPRAIRAIRVIDTAERLQVGYRRMFRRHHHVHRHRFHFSRGPVQAELHVI